MILDNSLRHQADLVYLLLAQFDVTLFDHLHQLKNILIDTFVQRFYNHIILIRILLISQ